MKVENRAWLQNDGGTEQAGRAQQNRTQADNKSVCRSEVRCAHSRAIKDQKLVHYQQRFGDDGSRTTRAEQACNRYDKVYEKHGDLTYDQIIVTESKEMTRLGNLSHLCDKCPPHVWKCSGGGPVRGQANEVHQVISSGASPGRQTKTALLT